jgi:hypothetical protein
MIMGERMKGSALLAAVCLVACQDLTMTTAPPSSDPGIGAPMNEPIDNPTDDPGDDPFLGDINNAWNGNVEGVHCAFNFAAASHGKVSSAVIRGTADIGPLVLLQLDGVFYGQMIHFTATRDATALTFDGMFLDSGTMELTVKESQAHVFLSCSTAGGACL